VNMLADVELGRHGHRLASPFRAPSCFPDVLRRSTVSPYPLPSEESTGVAVNRRRRRRLPRRCPSSAAPIRRRPTSPAAAEPCFVLRVSRRTPPLPSSPRKPCSAAGAGRPASRAGRWAFSPAQHEPRWPWAFLANVAWLVGLRPHCQPRWLG
jgi:hypothetical protein